MSDSFFEQPPLLRRRTSIVRRADLEAANMAREQRKLLVPNLKKLIYSIVNWVWCTFIWYGATYWGEQNAECNANFAWQLAIAAWTLSTYDIVFRMYIQCKYRNARFVGNPAQEIQTYTTLHTFVFLLGVSIWWYWSQIITWSASTTACSDTAYIWQFIAYITYIVTIILTGFATFGVTIMVLLMLCCLPCIIVAIQQVNRERAAANAEENQGKDDVIQGLIKRVYDPNQYTAQTECAICMCEFTPDDMITPLPCSVQHYFHAECLTTWMQQKTECPLCRTKIDAEALAVYSEQVDTVVAEYNQTHAIQRKDSFGSDDSFKNADNNV